MGLSSKQVSTSSGLDWNQALLEAQNLELPTPPLVKKQQHQNQQSEPLKCPRCDSTNTKFCYYNNYNKSQPRHFCRTCKRHWTKGGTLRNVPVGGGRKTKRIKKSTTTDTSARATATATAVTAGSLNGGLKLNTHMAIQTPQQRHNLPLAVGDQKGISPSICQAMICPPFMLPQQQNLVDIKGLESKDFGNVNDVFLGSISTMPLHQNQSLSFPFSTSSSDFDTNPCSVSTTLRSSSVYNYVEDFKSMEEPIINSVLPSTGGFTQPSKIPATSDGMEMANYWSWEDIDSLVSTDLNHLPWEDSDTKP